MTQPIKLTTDVDSVGRLICEVISGKFAGCRFCYDRVQFTGGYDSPVLKFEYFIKNDFSVAPNDTDEFVELLGDYLHDMLLAQLTTQTAVFYGGVN